MSSGGNSISAAKDVLPGDRRHPVAATIAWLLVVFLVLFPKGGVKISAVPITWGYVVLGVTALPLTAVRLIRFRLRFRIPVLLAASTLIPFGILTWYSIRQNGVLGVGSLLSNLTGFVLLPALFLLVYPSFLPLIDFDAFSRWFRFCVLGAALWGIFLFFWRPIFGSLIEIPLLTVNLGDFGQIETTKHIDRGAFLKLISTYNNGNVYGVATLILFPLYMRLEPRLWKRNILRIALIFTLSRTVWVGLIVEQLLSLGGLALEFLRTFPRLNLGRATKRFAAIVFTIALVGVGLVFSLRSFAFLFDTTLGGRGGELLNLLNPTFLPSLPYQGFAEIVYLSALRIYGISGMLSMLLIFLFPIVLMALFPRLLEGDTGKAAAKGLILYSILAAADGAINLIPVLAFYWFVYMVFLCGLPGEQRELLRARTRVAVTPSSDGMLHSTMLHAS